MKVVIPDDPNFRPFSYEQGRLGALGVEVALSDANDAALERKAAEAEVLFNLGGPLSRTTLVALRRCQLIVFYGIGIDAIDVAAATELGIL